MMQSKFQGRFSSRRSAELSEDVNPSAYIVNLADCMLVLACGFMVAMMAYWGIDLSATLTDEDLEEVEADVVPEDVQMAGSNYIEAGKVYYDPTTESYYILKQDAEEIAAEEEAETNAAAGQSSSETSETNENADNVQQSGDQAASGGGETG